MIRPMPRHRLLAAALTSFALIAACGGGGQDANAPTNPPPSGSAAASAAPTDTAPATASAAPSASAPPSATTATPTATATTAAAAPPPGPPGPGDWDKWSHQQKFDYMKASVMPKMTGLFKGFDSVRFGDVKCKTCHGAKADDGSFIMPNPDLPKLDMKGMLKTEKAKNPKMVEFMTKHVTANMQTLLGETPKDFGCTNCHTTK
jgi:hypothetical protein